MGSLIAYIIFLLGISLPRSYCYEYDDYRLPSYVRRKACSKYVNIVQPKSRVYTTSRLELLRNVMLNETLMEVPAIQAYIVTSDDEHQSEFVSEYDSRRQYISGFSGGRGDAIITLNKSALWVEGRYHLQANDQLDCNWLLMREGLGDVPSKVEWLIQELQPGDRIGADPKLISEDLWNELESKLKNSSLHLTEINVNLINLIWPEDVRPAQRNKDVFVLSSNYTGKTYLEKIAETRAELRNLNADAIVITALDEIAWLLNIRGRDIPFAPLVRSYAILDRFHIWLYVNSSQLVRNSIIREFHADFGVNTQSVLFEEYDHIWEHLPTLCQTWNRVLLPTKFVYSLGASHKIYQLVPRKKQLPCKSPIIKLKAKKNPVETNGIIRAHLKDAVALCEFFQYFETRFNVGDTFTETDIVTVLGRIRYQQEDCTGNSFRTVAAFGPNGAFPRYEPSLPTDLLIDNNNTLILDSGGQYLDGTTDVTRTIHMGEPTDEHKQAYTHVLKAHIRLSSLSFPSTLTVGALDIQARTPLWGIGYNYLHETGHGIGAFLTAHESPISLQSNSSGSDQVLLPDYFLTSEPGLYREDEFGVRLENVMRVIEKPSLKFTPNVTYLGFEDVTLVPYAFNLIDLSLLSNQERQWLNDYNHRIRRLVGEELRNQDKLEAYVWMADNTEQVPLCKGVIHKLSSVITFVFFLLQFI